MHAHALAEEALNAVPARCKAFLLAAKQQSQGCTDYSRAQCIPKPRKQQRKNNRFGSHRDVRVHALFFCRPSFDNIAVKRHLASTSPPLGA